MKGRKNYNNNNNNRGGTYRGNSRGRGGRGSRGRRGFSNNTSNNSYYNNNNNSSRRGNNNNYYNYNVQNKFEDNNNNNNNYNDNNDYYEEYDDQSNNNNNNNYNNSNYNNYNNYNDNNNYNEEGNYNENEESTNDNNSNNTNNKYQKYYNPHYQRHKGDDFAKDTHRNQYNKKREYNRKLYNEKKQQEAINQEKELLKEQEKNIEENINQKYYGEEHRIQGKLLELELKQEEEKEENLKQTAEQREEIKKDLNTHYDFHMDNLNNITKVEDKKTSPLLLKNSNGTENIFKKIVYKNPRLKTNPLLIYNIMEIFKAKKSSDEMQGEFTDLLGFDEIETVCEFITNRDEICELINIAKTAIDNSKEISLKQENLKLFGNTSIGIVEENKKNKNKNKKNNNLNEIQKLQNENKQILTQLGFEPSFFVEKENLENFEGDEINLNKFGINDENNEIIGGNQEVPEDNFGKVEESYVKKVFGDVGYNENVINDKEIYTEKTLRTTTYIKQIVKYKDKERKKTEPLNVIKVLPKWAQLCFDFKFFNEIQSIVFDKCYNSDENILITAPTGSGKTNIALITILREIQKEIKMKNIPVDAFDDKDEINFNTTWDLKILFLVPLKALANEFLNKFKKQLAHFNLVINEFSGDVDLTKEQIDKTNLFVGIPEKWDLFTRKHDDIFKSLKLMIIDEVHLLNEDRGRVLECIVARTIRKSEVLQKFTRLVGLSATLPNYYDVADFLRVKEGLFAFDSSYRATPLVMKFFGLKDKGPYEEYKNLENELVYDEVIKYLKKGKQVLVFVHSRMETMNYAKELYRLAQINGDTEYFRVDFYDNDATINNNNNNKNKNKISYEEKLKKNLSLYKTNNKTLQEIIPFGIGFHNAGLLRKDRNIVEKLFEKRNIKVLVSTSTLAWGVNLPAYAVIIKGTLFYDAAEGKKVDISILDVIQMFGRAGRPQFDTKGVGEIFCPMNKLGYFVSKLKNQINIESTLDKFLADSLNAEIAIGNIASLDDALNWLKLTYLSVLKTGRKRDQNGKIVENMIKKSFGILNLFKLIRYVKITGRVHSTELGRIASNYYMSYITINEFNEKLRENMFDEELLELFSTSNEFKNLKTYDEEKPELAAIAKKFKLLSENNVRRKSIDDIPKPIILLYAYLHGGGYEFQNASLFMDMMYIMDNSPRIFRAIVEICIHKKLIQTTHLAINYMKLIDKKIEPGTTPLWQFTYESANNKNSVGKKYKTYEEGYLPSDTCRKLDAKGYTDINKIMQENSYMLSQDLNIHINQIVEIKNYIKHIPYFNITVEAKPLTRTILNINLTLEPRFKWSKKWNGLSENFWLLVNNKKEIIHDETFNFTPKKEIIEGKKKYIKLKEIVLSFSVPFDIEQGATHARLDSVYTISIISQKWIDCHQESFIELNEIEVPQDEDVKTELLDLFPLPLSALQNKDYENVFKKDFFYFNPIQTQIFHSVYHSDENLLIGAPTGSGKTVIAELAILRLFTNSPSGKVIYIAPLKSLSKERVNDWKKKFEFLSKNVIELTGDFTPDLEMLMKADILITTPEKWDGISRNWHHRNYVKRVNLIIIDEIHLLGLERGPIIEVIVSRMRFMCHKLKSKVRFVGLSTALANSKEVADWLGIDTKYSNKRPPGLFNFRPAVRPCPVTVHIEGFAEKKYCPRMGTMNLPCYNAILNFSENKPVLIFVSSRRQTRLTAMDLIALSANNNKINFGDNIMYPFLKTSIEEIESYIDLVQDENLKNSLLYGIGLHHAGLIENDRKIVENLFLNQKILILIATSTLAWGVNFPAHLVIIKGTEYYHPKLMTYVDMPITDILQMIGRAGRPQYDNEAVACLFVKQDKKNFYKKFLYEPFPLESSLHKMLYDHINAEISSGMLTDKKLCIEYIKWTYFFKRLVKNPTFYGLSNANDSKILNNYINELLNKVLKELNEAGCIKINEDDTLESTALGGFTSFYYMSYKSAKFFNESLKKNLTIIELIKILSLSEEFSEVPVRHTEDDINKQMAQELPIKDPKFNYGKPSTKAHLLIQAHFCRKSMPISDYNTDLKTVLDNCIRILLFMADIASEKNILDTLLNILNLIQMIMQGLWMDDCSLRSLPGIELKECKKIRDNGKIEHLCELCEYVKKLYQDIVFEDNNSNNNKSKNKHKKFKEVEIPSSPNKNEEKEEKDKNVEEKEKEEKEKKEKEEEDEKERKRRDNKLRDKIKDFIENKCQIKNLENEELSKLSDVLIRLPILDVSYRLYSLDQNTLGRIYDRPIVENSDVQLSITLMKYNDIKNNLVIYSRYPKIKSVRWFIIIGNVKTNEVLAFEKVGFKEKKHRKITFTAPSKIDEDSVKLYILSDSYFGLDQEYNLNLKQINKGIMDKYGIIEIKEKNVSEDEKEDKDKDNNKNDNEDFEKETQKDEDDEENDDDIYLENW